ncbi:hypothetical protein, partial [Membranihabitans maritimus]|uniref:hypothetical protein n=1 Tax=Membranihabitans maritimus TaxID=2904244 RepID=UPI001F25EF12
MQKDYPGVFFQILSFTYFFMAFLTFPEIGKSQILPNSEPNISSENIDSLKVLYEMEGIDFPLATPSNGSAVSYQVTKAGVVSENALLLIPESTNDRVMAFDANTGDLVNENFIPSDPNNLSTPIHAIVGPSGSSILVSDQLEDVVQEYDIDGNYLGIFAPQGGGNTFLLDNVRGMALRANGNLLVTVGGGNNADAIAEFDSEGNYLGNFISNGTGGLDSPFDIINIVQSGGGLNSGEWLVGGITSDAIHRYNSSGAFISNFTSINTFPEQLYQIPDGPNAGNVLIANFEGTDEGIIELDPNGNTIGIYNPQELGGYRGVYELSNQNILVTTGLGVYEINRNGELVETKISGVSARFISPFRPGIVFDSSPNCSNINPGINKDGYIQVSAQDLASNITSASIFISELEVSIYNSWGGQLGDTWRLENSDDLINLNVCDYLGTELIFSLKNEKGECNQGKITLNAAPPPVLTSAFGTTITEASDLDLPTARIDTGL